MPNKYRLPRAKCKLCASNVIWVEKIDGSKVAINESPVLGLEGQFRRVKPDLVDGAINVVETVPENQRWLYETLYQPHNETCFAMIRCRKIKIYGFRECEDYLGNIPF